MADKILALLQLARPANVVTAWADVLAGIAISGFVAALPFFEALALPQLYALLLSTTGLYAGGVVFNDVFDARLDATERPERPIPSGRASKGGAALFGSLLLTMGITAAFTVSTLSGTLAASIALGALIYDFAAKHHPLAGPITMGLCRAGNLLLGISILPASLYTFWPLAAIPLLYVGAITLISRGEVHGGSSFTGYLGLGLVSFIFSILAVLAWNTSTPVLISIPFLLLFGALVLPPFFKAARQPEASLIKKAVKAGILALIPLNATWSALFMGWEWGLAVLVLLPLSLGLARLFAVT